LAIFASGMALGQANPSQAAFQNEGGGLAAGADIQKNSKSGPAEN
jgi:hypothetical protein